MNTNDYKYTHPETFQRGKHTIIRQLFCIMCGVLLRRQREEKAHIREQMLWFIHPACWRSQRANPHLWFRFTAGECINPYCFLLMSCHFYFSLYLPPSGHVCLLCHVSWLHENFFILEELLEAKIWEWNIFGNTALMKLNWLNMINKHQQLIQPSGWLVQEL